MDLVTSYNVQSSTVIETVVDGALRQFEFSGDVSPADGVEAALLADLVIAGLASAVDPKATKKSIKPTDLEE